VQSVGVIEFGADGAYYGGPLGTNLDTTYVYDGSYDLGSGSSPESASFQLSYSCGDGCNSHANS
jgi:hypothetical protein